MPPSVDGQVQTQRAVAVPDGVLGTERSGSGGICTRMVGRGHISVQTESEGVLGIDVEWSDNAQIVTRKMQTMFDVPMDQTALVFGDAVLHNILSKGRSDTPVLLTRGLQRSLSTPCLSLSSDA